MWTLRNYKFFTLYFCGLLLLTIFANPYTTDYNVMLAMSLSWLITPVVGTIMGVIFAHRQDTRALLVFSLLFITLVSFGRLYRNTEATINYGQYLDITHTTPQVQSSYRPGQNTLEISGILEQSFPTQIMPATTFYDPTPIIRGLVAVTVIFPGVFTLIGLWCGYGITVLIERVGRSRELRKPASK